jgi:tetraacyldisaccharide 4'-kinase
VIDWLWYSETVAAAGTRVALQPLSALYRAAAAARNAMYDRGLLDAVAPALPTISVGNLSVGGTGKTPFSSWLARQLEERGIRAAIVMRGYGEDEPLVHAILNSNVPVVVDADRVRGVQRAAARGAQVAVLDDGFQHRRVRRSADMVLMSADRWGGAATLLPAGPFREGLGSLRRASLAVLVSKAAPDERLSELSAAIAAAAPGLPQAVLRLLPQGLVQVNGSMREPLDALAGATVVLATAIGDPRALATQLEMLGARVLTAAYRDHHRFTASDAARIAALAARADRVVCTLKDAVKLGPLWAEEDPGLWYISQQVILDRGHSEIDRLIDTVLRETMAASPAKG